MANLGKAQKRKKAVQRVIAAVALVLVVLLAAVLQVRKNVRRQVTAQNSSTVKSAQVTTGSIQAADEGRAPLRKGSCQPQAD